MTNSKKTLYIDVDSTIWPAELEYEKAAQELYGKPFGANWYSHEQLVELFDKDYVRIFDAALDPEKVADREMYPFAHDAMIVLSQWFHLHFLSYNHRPDAIKPKLYNWLSSHFLADAYTLSVVDHSNCKTVIMNNDDTAWGIIEDQPTALYRAHLSGYNVIARRHLWNEDVIAHFDLPNFVSWYNVPWMVQTKMKEEFVVGSSR